MWSQLFTAASLSKSALAVGVAASAAMVSSTEFSNTPSHHEAPNATPITSPVPATRTAPKNDSSSGPSAAALQHGAVPELFKECVERYLALRELGDAAPLADRQLVGEVCKAALAQSGLSGAAFWAKFGPDAHQTESTTEVPKSPDLGAPVVIRADVEGWIRECVTKYTRRTPDATETCKKAIELTGLTSGQFAEKYLWTTGDTKPVTSPSTKPVSTPKPATTTKPVTNTSEVSGLVVKCLDLYRTVTSVTPDTKSVSEACGSAIKATGLTSAAFWAKYHPATN